MIREKTDILLEQLGIGYKYDTPTEIERKENTVFFKYNLKYIGETDTNVRDNPKSCNYRKEETEMPVRYDRVYPRLSIKKVIFNAPATIVFWDDGTKTVVKCENEEYDPEKGLAMAVAKKALGNQGNYYNQFKKWMPKKEEEDEGPTVIIPDIGSPLHEAAKRLAEGVNSALSSLKKDSE